RNAYAAPLEGAKELWNPVEQGNAVRRLCAAAAHVAGDPRHLPEAYAEIANDLAVRLAAEHFQFVIAHLTEPMILCDLVERAHEPGRAIGQRAVEVEYDQTIVGHLSISRLRACSTKGSRLRCSNWAISGRAVSSVPPLMG